MTNFKKIAYSALLAGVFAIPVSAQAVGNDGSAASSTSMGTTATNSGSPNNAGNGVSGSTGATGSGSVSSSGTMLSSQQFSALDTDRSGSLSAAEFRTAASSSIDFDQADTDSDGRLTLTELQSAQNKD